MIKLIKRLFIRYRAQRLGEKIYAEHQMDAISQAIFLRKVCDTRYDDLQARQYRCFHQLVRICRIKAGIKPFASIAGKIAGMPFSSRFLVLSGNHRKNIEIDETKFNSSLIGALQALNEAYDSVVEMMKEMKLMDSKKEIHYPIFQAPIRQILLKGESR